jgi:tight adherence protein C
MYNGIASMGIRILTKVRLLMSGNTTKKIEKLRSKNNSLRNGNLGRVNLFVIPGYVLQREFNAIGKGQVYAAILKKHTELHGKKHSAQKAIHLLAKLISYAAIFITVSLTVGAIAMRVGNMVFGAAVMGVSIALVLVLAYAMYDDLSERVKTRRAQISKEFPNVVSKLALLVTSGMIMDKAWKLTALSREHELYSEMRQTSEEMDNLVSPEAALGNFINRCNTKETAKLAGVIMQNLSKGNAQIGKLLREMAHEAWLERRHKAKRDAEKANSKLMIPTMMLFLAILIMLMVPIVMSFSGM